MRPGERVFAGIVQCERVMIAGRDRGPVAGKPCGGVAGDGGADSAICAASLAGVNCIDTTFRVIGNDLPVGYVKECQRRRAFRNWLWVRSEVRGCSIGARGCFISARRTG